MIQVIIQVSTFIVNQYPPSRPRLLSTDITPPPSPPHRPRPLRRPQTFLAPFRSIIIFPRAARPPPLIISYWRAPTGARTARAGPARRPSRRRRCLRGTPRQPTGRGVAAPPRRTAPCPPPWRPRRWRRRPAAACAPAAATRGSVSGRTDVTVGDDPPNGRALTVRRTREPRQETVIVIKTNFNFKLCFVFFIYPVYCIQPGYVKVYQPWMGQSHVVVLS